MGDQHSSFSHRTTRLRNKQTHLAVTYLREGGSWRLAIRWNHSSLAITGFPELSVETVKI